MSGGRPESIDGRFNEPVGGLAAINRNSPVTGGRVSAVSRCRCDEKVTRQQARIKAEAMSTLGTKFCIHISSGAHFFNQFINVDPSYNMKKSSKLVIGGFG